MDYKYIEQLLERYWDCRTSLEEEQILRSFFSQKDVPQCLQQYRDLFVYQNVAHEQRLGEDFDRRMLSLVETPKTVKARTVGLGNRLAPFLKAAATVAVVVLIGNAAEHSMKGGGNSRMNTEAPLTDTYVKADDIPAALSPSVFKIKDNSQAEIRTKMDTLLVLPKMEEIKEE
ncbi:MAG: hypothetical protein NC206_05240 [Bacteroides sp.]|nr:hypothetical protein [Roseburia sp.]MCM1346470.1 hypothetical protein [Bacteroides sp.]MCM1420339.1 hypothetical protein [Bacteroides sp.]